MKLPSLLPLFLLAPLTGIAPTAQAEPGLYNLLVGTYTSGSSQGLYVYRFDSRAGQINGPLRVVKASNPSYLSLSRDGRTVFVVNENGRGSQGDDIGRATSYRFDPSNGRLQQISQVKTLGDHPTHSTLSPDGKFLFVANYSVEPEGSLAVLPVQDNSVLSPVAQIEFFQASKAHPERQVSGHVHGVTFSPDGQYLFAPDLGADKVFAYRYNPAKYERPLTLADTPYVPVPAGSGPRHLVFSADGRFAYLTLELTGQVMVFAHENGTLRQLQLYTLAPEGFNGRVGAGALHLSSDGRFLYAVNRGDDNHIDVFAVDPVEGTLSFIERHSVNGLEPREFAIDPTGRYLLVANQKSNQVKVFARDPQTGELGDELQSVDISMPSDLKFVAVP
ncbi:6-phosphogluconolactonase (cycloisomerase 2 family) [Pseudomonas duriflava]|uniref:6-phosphogluconolactonase (Cycloisomerase 2 family) n=1 Tax=Pseudomonas duriflava TaxID=459528 RepID=A0A562QMX1_9PSED|nr:lactonase family protein [Pseudomonas duriflava]TWI57550.1 6-phosphogluconolactonase (cycloisomerase 2 family) [Pseudomonas duriflava]